MPSRSADSVLLDRPSGEPARWLAEACAAHRAGDLEQAQALYRAVLAERPGQPDALHLLGLIRFEQGEPEEARRLVEQAIAIAGDRPDYHYNLGKILQAGEELEAARSAYGRALDLDPDNAGALLNLGTLWRRLGAPKRAEACFRRVLDRDAGHALAHNNLATICRADGRLDEAVDHYRRAAELRPEAAAIWHNFAKALSDLGRNGEALEAYRRTLALDPGRADARHMTAALSGETPARPPDDYVRELFDHYAERFEGHLTRTLDYRVPGRLCALAERLRPASAEGHAFACALDLGCGTGLVGEGLRPLAARLEGLDLSAEMLARARAKGLYDALIEAEAVRHLAGAPAGSWDLVVAADVLIYLGALDAMMPAVHRAMQTGGLFVFSVERLEADEGDFRLRPSGRYAHGRGYLERLAAASGFALEAWEEAPLRKHGAKPLLGWLIALARR